MAFNEISSVNMDTECMGGRELAYVEKKCSENEVHVFALGQSSKAIATDSDQHTSWGFHLQTLEKPRVRTMTYAFIIDWLNSSAIPGEAALFSASPAAKSFW